MLMNSSYRLPAWLAAWRRALCVVSLVAAVASAARATDVADVPNVRLRDASQYVSDPSAILSAAARDSINRMLSGLERTTGVETAVVVLQSIGDADIFDFAHRLFRSWGIGKKDRDNGLLILFVMDQHKVRFTTGYGLEGTLTDAMSKRIQQREMVPCFRRGDWDGGMVQGVRAVVDVTGKGIADAVADGADDDGVAAVPFVVLAALLILWAVVAAGRSQKCPKCGRKGLRRQGEQRLTVAVGRGRRRRILRTTYVCKYCGHVVTRDSDDDGGGAAMATGAMMGTMLGGSGRGFSGGSFGGGSTGGGGATSGW